MAIGIAVLVLFLLSFVFVGNLGPIPALVYGPIAFVVSLVIFLIIESLLALNSQLSRKNTYIGLLVVCLVPIVYILAFEPLAFGIDYKAIVRDFNHTKSIEQAPPLTEQERLQLQSTRLNLIVGVVSARYPDDTSALIKDLQETCLFEVVDESDQLEGADIFATIIKRYYFNKEGWDLSIYRPEKPKEPYLISLHVEGDHHQYIKRLAEELFKASRTLFSLDELLITKTTSNRPNEKQPCKSNYENITLC